MHWEINPLSAISVIKDYGDEQGEKQPKKTERCIIL